MKLKLTPQQIVTNIQFLENWGYVPHALVVALISFALMLVTGWSIAGLVFATIGFSVFDLIGFTIATEGLDDTTSAKKTVLYRVIQVFTQLVMYALVWKSCGLIATLACAVAWWFTVCDKLFYVIGKSDYKGNYPWLEGWSLFFILKKLGINADDKSFNAVVLVGSILAIGLCIFL